jgi:hypothetical protein
MNDRGNDGPYRPPAKAPAKRTGMFDEARELFGQLAGEAERRDAEQRAGTPPRGPVGKALVFATIVAAAVAAGTLFYGIYNFLDAPIRQTPTGYANKAGQPASRERYEAFQLWEKTFIASFVVVFASACATVVEERVRKRRRD